MGLTELVVGMARTEPTEDRQDALFTVAAQIDILTEERDRIRRLFTRLDGCINHHKKMTAGVESDADDVLYRLRDKVVSDYAAGKG